MSNPSVLFVNFFGQVKGQVACELSSADELVVTELLFSGALKSLDTNSLVAVMSCFVSFEKSGSRQAKQRLKPELQSLLTSVRPESIPPSSLSLSLPKEENDFISLISQPDRPSTRLAICAGSRHCEKGWQDSC